MKIYTRIVICLVSLYCLGAHARFDANPNFEQASRTQFLAAEQAIQQGQKAQIQYLLKDLKSYALYPYLLYENMIKKIRSDALKGGKNVSLKELQTFTRTYPDFGLTNRLLYYWLLEEAKAKRWDSFISGYKLKTDDFRANSIQCLYHYAQYQTTQDTRWLKKARDLWGVGHSQPKACNPLFDVMLSKNILGTPHILKRIELSLKKKKLGLARYLIGLLPDAYHAYGPLWLRVTQKPELLNKASIRKAIAQSPFTDSIYESAFYHWARQDLQQAKQAFQQYQALLPWTDYQKQLIQQDIGIRLAHNKDHEAYLFLINTPKPLRSEVGQQWLIRLSLYEKNWSQALRHIEELPQKAQALKQWQYWKARALIGLRQYYPAHHIFQKLADTRSFYGFLASDYLKRPIALKHESIHSDPARYRQLREHPALKRIQELLALDRVRTARIEWYFLLKKLKQEEKLEAALFAHQQGWHALAILAFSKMADKDDLNIRFPFAFQESIQKHANRCDLDPAWVFALTRQESGFAHQVRSPVGATGLMQLMPATARYVAQKHQLPQPSLHDLMEPEKNITLGTTYLQSLQAQLKNQLVLSTASYNAGMGRIQSWLPPEPIDSDIWIENIPFLETRHYVKNVITYMAIYKNLMNEPFELKTIMSPVSQAHLAKAP